ncbi:hypothetical protein RKD24_001176 [Streptomyces calvus]
MDVLLVAERGEGLPARDGEVTGGRRCGMVPAPLGAPAQLFLVRQCGQAVDGHEVRRQCELTVVHGHGYQGPHPVQPAGAEDLGRTAGSAPGLGDALDLIDGAGGQVADEQQLHDGPGRTADGLARRRAACQCGRWGEDSGVQQTAGAQGESPAQAGQLRRGRRSRAGWAQQVVCQPAPAAPVARGMGDAAADVPAAGLRHPGHRQFVRMQPHQPVVGPQVALDRITAFAAGRGLAASQQPAGTVGGDTQGPPLGRARAAAVPAPRGRRRRGAHAGEPASRHAPPAVRDPDDPPGRAERGDNSANACSRIR